VGSGSDLGVVGAVKVRLWLGAGRPGDGCFWVRWLLLEGGEIPLGMSTVGWWWVRWVRWARWVRWVRWWWAEVVGCGLLRASGGSDSQGPGWLVGCGLLGVWVGLWCRRLSLGRPDGRRCHPGHGPVNSRIVRSCFRDGFVESGS
jgi:hypothetical protein